MEAALKAISDPTRREILQLVRSDELPAGAIASRFTMTRPAVSQHLKVLKDAGLLEERRQGVRRLYRTSPSGFGELRRFLEQFWDDRLVQLKAAAEAEEALDARSRERRNANQAGDPD
jgi:DNA-binding transcriptional ArsR family regulator